MRHGFCLCLICCIKTEQHTVKKVCRYYHNKTEVTRFLPCDFLLLNAYTSSGASSVAISQSQSQSQSHNSSSK